MIHISVLQDYLLKQYVEGSTFIPLEEILQLYKDNNE